MGEDDEDGMGGMGGMGPDMDLSELFAQFHGAGFGGRGGFASHGGPGFGFGGPGGFSSFNSSGGSFRQSGFPF